MLFSLIALAVVVLSPGVASQNPHYTNCNDIPNYPMNSTQVMLASPLKLLRSSDPSMTCALAFVTGPGPLGFCDNYVFFFVQGKRVIFANAVDPNSPASGSTAVSCGAGDTTVYKFVPYDLTGPNPYMLSYLCGITTGKILLVVGFGHDETKVGPILDRQIKYYLSNISGGNDVKKVWCGCPGQKPFCAGYFN